MESVVDIRLLIICTVLIMAGTACWGFANEVRLRECRRSLLRAERQGRRDAKMFVAWATRLSRTQGEMLVSENRLADQVLELTQVVDLLLSTPLGQAASRKEV